jgi:DnaJ-class molecular chaperone
MRVLLCTFLIAAFAAPCVAEKVHDSDWKTGKLTDVRFEKDSRIVGGVNQNNGVVTQRRNDSTYYEIDAGDLVYVVKQALRHKHDKQLNLTVNAPVKYAIVKGDFYVLDEDGKQQKLSIEKKTLKATP